MSLVLFCSVLFLLLYCSLVDFVSVLHCCIAMLSGGDVVSLLSFVLFG